MPNIIRIQKTKDYFVASNKPFNDKNLSFGARGILAYILSKPDNWEIRSQDLYKQSPAGRAAVDRMLKELMDNGYMRRGRENDEKGYLHWVTIVYEDRTQNPDWNPPNAENRAIGEKQEGIEEITPEIPEPIAENRAIGEPNVEKPIAEKTAIGKLSNILSTKTTQNTEITPNGVSDKSLPGDKPKKEKPQKSIDKPGPRKKLMGAFTSATNMCMPKNKKTAGFWWSQIAEIEHIIGGDVSLGQELIAETVKDMRRDKLSIGGPQSIINLVRDKASARASPNGNNGKHYDEATLKRIREIEDMPV